MKAEQDKCCLTLTLARNEAHFMANIDCVQSQLNPYGRTCKQQSISRICPLLITVCQIKSKLSRFCFQARIRVFIWKTDYLCLHVYAIWVVSQSQIKTPQSLWSKTVCELPHGRQNFLGHFLCLVSTCQGQPFVGPKCQRPDPNVKG